MTINTPTAKRGRPSIDHRRIPQILDATGRCLARWGVDGLTLEKVAAEAGLSRSLIRHYVGNRNDLVLLYRRRMVERYTFEFAPDPDRGMSVTEVVADTLLTQTTHLEDYAAIDALLAASRADANLRSEIRGIYTHLETAIADAILTDHPEWGQRHARQSAYHALALAYGNWTMSSLDFPDDRQEAASAAIRTLLGLDPAPDVESDQ